MDSRQGVEKYGDRRHQVPESPTVDLDTLSWSFSILTQVDYIVFRLERHRIGVSQTKKGVCYSLGLHPLGLGYTVGVLRRSLGRTEDRKVSRRERHTDRSQTNSGVPPFYQREESLGVRSNLLSLPVPLFSSNGGLRLGKVSREDPRGGSLYSEL